MYILYRIRRWKCCDATNQGAIGCCQKYHTPPEADVVYDKILSKMNAKDEEEALDLNERLIHVHIYQYTHVNIYVNSNIV